MIVVADQLARLARDPSRTGLFLDFDGVLADIVPDPDGARVRVAVPSLLSALHARLGRVVVVSGRPITFLDEMIPAEIDVVGLYGLEWRIDGSRHTLPQAEAYREVVAQLVAAAIERFGPAVVEPKGLSLTIHYRSDSALEAPMRLWAAEAGGRTGMEHRRAKQSFELHPPIRRDKGTVVVEMAAGLESVAYVGDDLGDLPAFDGLDELAAGGVTTLRVAVDSPETPPILRRRADLVVDGPVGAEQLLVQLLAAVS